MKLRSIIAIGLLAYLCELAGADEQNWINVRDIGASGSKFETTAVTTGGSKQITVMSVGDFKVGQGVMVSKSNIRYTPTQLWGTGERYKNMKPLNGSVEVRGYDGSAGSWVVYVLDIAPSPSGTPAFRWSDDLGRTWQPEQPISNDWQTLNGGIEVRLNKRDWEAGYVIAFGARDQLVSRIEKIEGHALTLAHAANQTVKDATVWHNDSLALQAAVDLALKEKRKVFVPAGHYRLAHGIQINNPESITVEGASAEDSVLDISAVQSTVDGEGRCITLTGGAEAVIRNLRFVGFMGFDERDKAGELDTRGSNAVWGFALKPCHAVAIFDTQRVLVENCHASRMSGECFLSASRSRSGLKSSPPGGFHNPSVNVDLNSPTASAQSSCQGITYLRCSVTDSARNAFNDVLCGGEFTSVQNCRIIDVGGCAWEGASRFVKITGNYLRNAGTIAIGNLGPGNRDASFPDLGAGQHIVADNVFESNVPYGGFAIHTSRGATQVIIRNNLFINFNSSGVATSAASLVNEYPSANTTITGNIFDMTAIGQDAAQRTAITVRADDTIVSDNQIYVRRTSDATVTGIRLSEPAMNATIHDNLIRNCGTGIVSIAAQSTVGEIVDAKTFVSGDLAVPIGLLPHQYRGWSLAWFRGGRPDGSSVIEFFEPLTARFTLNQPHAIKPGDQFEVYPPSANWNIHDNTITDCLQPVVLDSHGSPTSVLKDNLISRGETSGTTKAIQIVRGQFALIGNRISNFGETESQSPTPAVPHE